MFLIKLLIHNLTQLRKNKTILLRKIVYNISIRNYVNFSIKFNSNNMIKYYKVPAHSLEHLHIEFKRAYALLDKLTKYMESIDDILMIDSEYIQDCPEEPQELEDDDDEDDIVDSDNTGPNPACQVFHSNDGELDLDSIEEDARTEASV